MLPPFLQSLLSRRWLILFWVLIASIPVVYIGSHAVASSRNIVFWDEFDTALDLILRIDAGADAPEVLQKLVAINNEHRTVTSRVLFALSYWLTGTINFHVIGAIGNLFIVGACVALVLAVHGWQRRVRLGVVLAFLIFQLEHFESFIWSGASIDHFQVVMLAVIAIVALVHSAPVPEVSAPAEAALPADAPAAPRRVWPWFAVAVFFAVLATFTLAHGNVTWAVGGLLLLYQRRWKQLAIWTACGGLAIAAFLHGFQLNPGHNIAQPSVDTALRVGRYWLALLGAPLTLGQPAWAPLPGVVLLIGLGFLVARGAAKREPVALAAALFAVGSLTLVAFGRTQIAGAEINSRYMILGALAWAMLVFMVLERTTRPDRPFRTLVWLTPALAAFNVSANAKFAPLIDTFIEVRDRAATSFQQFGEDGRGITRLHPVERHAEALLKAAEQRGVYRLPRFSYLASFSRLKENPAIVAYLDEMIVNDRAVTIGGWAMRPGITSEKGQVHVVLRSAKSQLVFSAVPLQRADVANVYKEPRWRFCGFRAVIERDELPAEDFDLGVLIADGGSAEFMMTKNRLLLSTPAEAKAVRLPASP